MEQRKNESYTACLEISSTAAKFAIGSVINGEPILVYYVEKPIRGCLKDGQIIDPETIKKTIASLISVQSEELRIKINSANVCIVVPPLGLRVYQTDRTTNVVAPTNLIDHIDITNVMSIVKKQQIPDQNVIVDIIPDLYIIDGNKAYANPPVGEKSSAISVRAKLQTLPEPILHSYYAVVEQAGFRVYRASLAPYCASQIIATSKDMPRDYLLVDIGAHLTSVSLIGNKTLITSLSFPKGGDDLTEVISTAFSIPFADAEKLKCENGYNTKDTLYRPILISSIDEQGKKNNYYQTDLNNAISSFVESYEVMLSNAINQTIEKQQSSSPLYSVPIILVGGGSLLFGLDKLLVHATSGHKLIFYRPTTMGARNPRLCNVLGMIVSQGSFHGSLQDNYHGVGSLSRDH
jgi:cell division protein FtsA